MVPLAEHLVNQFFGGRFAYTAGNPHHANIQLAPPKTRNGLEGFKRIFNPQAERRFRQALGQLAVAHIHAAKAGRQIFLNQCQVRPASEGLFNVVVPVHAFAGQRHKQRPRNHQPRIDCCLADNQRGRFGAGACQGFQNICQR